MVEYFQDESPPEEVLDAVFHALADGTRRSLLRQLSEGATSVTDLAAPHAMSLAAVSKHIQVLERAGLATREIQGRVHRLSLRPDNLRTAGEWVRYYQRFWDESLERLGELFADEGEERGSDD